MIVLMIVISLCTQIKLDLGTLQCAFIGNPPTQVDEVCVCVHISIINVNAYIVARMCSRIGLTN